MEKAPIQFGTLETQTDIQTEYSKTLTYQERLEQCFYLTEKAFWRELKNGIPKMDRNKSIQIITQKPGESLNDMFKRKNSNEHF